MSIIQQPAFNWPPFSRHPLIIHCNWTWFFHIRFHDLLAFNVHQKIFSDDDNKIIVFISTYLAVNWTWFFHYPHDVWVLNLFNCTDNHYLNCDHLFLSYNHWNKNAYIFFKEIFYRAFITIYLGVMLSNCQRMWDAFHTKVPT